MCVGYIYSIYTLVDTYKIKVIYDRAIVLQIDIISYLCTDVCKMFVTLVYMRCVRSISDPYIGRDAPCRAIRNINK